VEDHYARWSDLAGDDRWKQLTPRMLLNHASGFANFGFLEPDGKLRFHFDPGTRYSYSGDGIILLQFVLEKGLGLDVGEEMRRRVFQPLGMTHSSLIWRDAFGGHTADGWTIDGKPVPHDERSAVRAAGSMDTTIADMSRLAAAIARGDLISPAARTDFSRSQLPIRSASQFPTLQEDAPREQLKKGLAAGLGVVAFDGPQGHGFFKGGHNDSTGNMLVCLEAKKRCVVILGNDLRAEPAIPYLVDFILGATGVPWDWEYGSVGFWRPSASLERSKPKRDRRGRIALQNASSIAGLVLTTEGLVAENYRKFVFLLRLPSGCRRPTHYCRRYAVGQEIH
jgi:CubicO group peptidase (beta-lactamase class C family)